MNGPIFWPRNAPRLLSPRDITREASWMLIRYCNPNADRTDFILRSTHREAIADARSAGLPDIWEDKS